MRSEGHGPCHRPKGVSTMMPPTLGKLAKKEAGPPAWGGGRARAVGGGARRPPLGPNSSPGSGGPVGAGREGAPGQTSLGQQSQAALELAPEHRLPSCAARPPPPVGVGPGRLQERPCPTSRLCSRAGPPVLPSAEHTPHTTCMLTPAHVHVNTTCSCTHMSTCDLTHNHMDPQVPTCAPTPHIHIHVQAGPHTHVCTPVNSHTST